jgi:RNA polymerase sigma-70 factor (ECF subfamily)
MSSAFVTRASLLVRVRDPSDTIAWGDFVRLYGPLIYSYGLHHGLQDADAADLVQEVLRRASRTMPRFDYDPARGSFRGWLLTVTRNEIRKQARSRSSRAIGSGDTQMHRLLEEQADSSEPDAAWEREYRWNTLLWAADRVKPEFRENTFQAFWHSVIGGKEADIVARELGISIGAVYIAKSRVLARIKQEIAATLEE